MKEIGILMKGPLVRRSLDGRKTMTRRLVSPQPPAGHDRAAWFDAPIMGWTAEDVSARDWWKLRCPYGLPGLTKLWVRETWRRNCFVVPCEGPGPGVLHKATWTGVPVRGASWGLETDRKWRPSIFMPRAACRLELEVISVRVERLQDITDDDIRREGIADLELEDLLEDATKPAIIRAAASVGLSIGAEKVPVDLWLLHRLWEGMALRVRWHLVWNLINGHRPGARWADNPWVWVIGYRKV